MTHPILYHKGKSGAIYSWLVWTEDNLIKTEYGQLNGQKLLSEKKAVGKNPGKRNATTDEQQADIECLAMWTHKKERKYSETIEKAQEDLMLPMLAQDIQKKLKKAVFPGDIQPKLDGVRCLAIMEDGKVRLISRQGKEWVYVTHIQNELTRFMPQSTILDGELYIHGAGFQTLSSLVKKFRNPGEGRKDYGTEDVKFHIYDCPMFVGQDDLPWEERHQNLRDLAEEALLVGCKSIELVETQAVYTMDDVTAYQAQCLETGYEGAIFRNRAGLYLFGLRSSDLLKVKTFMDAEFRITGFDTGRGKNENTVTWVCQTTKGQEFRVAPMGSVEQRQEWLTNGENYVGQYLTVKFFEWTDDGVPRFPVGKGIRPAEDLPLVTV